MPMPIKRKRNAKRARAHSKVVHCRPGLRNAAPNGVRPLSPLRRGEPPRPTKKDKFYYLLESLGGAALTSYAGAWATRLGLAPELVSTVIGLTGGYIAVDAEREPVGHAARGAASVAGSQLLLLKFGPKPNAPVQAAIVATAVPPAATPPRKNADLGALPPGMLDAAFERARAELAVTGDGYPPGYSHEPRQFHHGPVMP